MSDTAVEDGRDGGKKNCIVGADRDRESYHTGGKRCASLQEIEAAVPAPQLFHFISCIFIFKPSVRELVRRYGLIAWSPSVVEESLLEASQAKSIASTSKSNRKAKKTIKITPVLKLATSSVGDTAENEMHEKSTFSTIQILRSLVVHLKPLQAKKASLDWAEQYVQESDTGDTEDRLLRQMKHQYNNLLIKSNVCERKARSSTSDHKRREIRRQMRQEKRNCFEEGRKLEESFLGRVEFKGSINHMTVHETKDGEDGSMNEEEIYVDDFEQINEL